MINGTEAAIQILNESLKLDYWATEQLINNRVNVVTALADHPDIVTTAEGEVGFLGILNGILSRMGQPKVCVVLGGSKILGFLEYGKAISLDFD